MRLRTALIVVLVATVVVGFAAPAAVAGTTSSELSIGVTQDAETGDATVTVTRGNESVENATVEVTVDGNASYAGNGTYTTDANGTVALPEPNSTVTVDVTASQDGTATTRTAELVPLDESVSVSVDQDASGTALVTVTQYGDPVENATVNVSATGNESYAGNGTYETGANGTVSLAAPSESLTVSVTATHDGLTGRTTAALDAPFGLTVEQFDDGTAAVTVTRGDDPVENATVEVEVVGNGSYAGNGTYETGANGTVSLPATEEEVEVTVNATDGDDTAETTFTLYTARQSGAFGRMVSDFVHGLLGGGERGIGHEVSAYATANNPGNGHGPPDHAGPPSDDDGDDRGRPDDTEGTDDGHEGKETAEDDRTDGEDEVETPDENDAAEDDEDDEGEEEETPGKRGNAEKTDDEDDGNDHPGTGNDSANGRGPPDHAGR